MDAFTIAGWGTALPERRVTNDDLAARLDTSDEWIRARSGIRERRIAGIGESTGTLAVDAARKALAKAELEPHDLDAIVVATSSPEQLVPSTAASVAATLGTTAGAFDVNAACAGFVYGLAISGGLISSGIAGNLLLIGADTITRFVDPDDRTTAVLFGDGAGALVLQAPAANGELDPEPGGLIASDLVGDPDAIKLLVIPAGGSAQPPTAETVASGAHYLQMEGREVFRRAVRSVADSINATLERADLKAGDIDVFVPHQANARIIEAVIDRVGIPVERTIQTVDCHGNTSSASVPLAIGEIADTDRLEDGSLLLTSGFGAGLTVGTSLLRWRESARGER